jgi:hypothetical protein
MIYYLTLWKKYNQFLSIQILKTLLIIYNNNLFFKNKIKIIFVLTNNLK